MRRGRRVSAVAAQVPTDRRVRVWFGEHVIADYRATAPLAERYADAMARRFAGLRVTNDPIGTSGGGPDDLPGERMWGVTPK